MASSPGNNIPGEQQEFRDFGDCESMKRSELQKVLKSWGLPSGGTNIALRERYRLHRDSKICNTTTTSTTTSIASASSAGATITSANPTVTKKKAPPPPAATAAEVKATSEQKKPAPEKRLKRYRNSPPNAVRQRIQRARTQRLFLVQKGEVTDLSCRFVVLGSTGNVYNVTIQKIPQCTCPDHLKGNLCKHILFVLLKVMAISPDSPLIYQAAWLTEELQEMFDQMNLRYRQVSGSVLANTKVRETFAKIEQGDDLTEEDDDNVARRQKVQDDDDCPICFDALKTKKNEKTAFCRARCGANFHQSCIETWLNQHRSNPTCPMCRETWDDGKKKLGADEGFTNLGQLQGQSPVRDTSTYSGWTSDRSYYKRRRRW